METSVAEALRLRLSVTVLGLIEGGKAASGGLLQCIVRHGQRISWLRAVKHAVPMGLRSKQWLSGFVVVHAFVIVIEFNWWRLSLTG